jgi:UDP-glucose 4-epimerase
MDAKASRVLVTGGAGYIGSHTVIELLQAGWGVTVIDNLSNGTMEALEQAAELGGAPVVTILGDVGDAATLSKAFERQGGVDAVIHFAGSKAVGESVAQPLTYYRNNVGATLVLLETMKRHSVRNLVFSSSCTVYGEPEQTPLDEDSRRGPISPYGRTKLVIEQMIEDVANSEPGWNTISLRYFNPVGAHPSGRIGEDPRGDALNLLPYVMGVAVGRYPFVRVYGTDYPTRDGTCIRDYVHVVDVATAHVAALERLSALPGARPVNLGTGTGTSVLEVIFAASKAVGRPIDYRPEGRRPGDVVATWADPGLAHRLLGWQADRDLDEMCADAWRWQHDHPHGFRSDPQPTT